LHHRIMDAAAEEINLRGVKFTMHDLAIRLGISKRTLYQCFSSKEELIESLVVAKLEDVKQQRDEVMRDNQLPFDKKLHKVLTLCPRIYSSVNGSHFEEIRRYLPGVWNKIEQFIDADWSVVETILQQAIEAKCFRPIYIPLVINILKGSTKQIINYDFAACGDISKPDMFNLLAEVVLYGVVKPKNEQGNLP